MASHASTTTNQQSNGSRTLPNSDRSETRRIAVTGASGLVGLALLPQLADNGASVTRIVRSKPADNDVLWDPLASSFDASKLNGVQTVVHLAGENIAASRWTTSAKRRIRDSRVVGTETLSTAIARLPSPPKTLVTASAIGFYGDRGEELLDEHSPAGNGFLADVARDWEAATLPAKSAGIRVVHLRFGMILSPRGGALAKMLLPFKLGVGGRVGSGQQWWSWISLEDAVGAVCHVIDKESLAGPVNVVSPTPVTNVEFTKSLGHALRRPTVFPMPAFAARLALGEMADELLLASIRVAPRQLVASGYEFEHPTVKIALHHLLSR